MAEQTEPNSVRPVARLVPARRALEGEGFPIRRPFPGPGLEDLDPFLMLDEVGPVDWPPGEAKGAPDHPHRGFETVSYMLSGEKLHEDSTGKSQLLLGGDVQWMTAGAGIVHSEMPAERFRQAGGRTHSFQIWVNLPAAAKGATPGYQYLPGGAIPLGRSEDGLIEAKVISGEAFGVSGGIGTHTPVVLQDWTVTPGGRGRIALPADQNAALYVFGGAVVSGPEATRVEDGTFAILGPGEAVEIAAPAGATEPARLLLLAGRPLHEPIARYGPFVMSTEAEIHEAIRDYQSGRMGTIRR